MDKNVLRILELLEPHGLQKRINIRNIINEIFPVPENVPEQEFNAARNHVYRFLETINKIDPPYEKKDGLIQFDTTLLNNLKQYRDVPDTWFDWFQASITQEGIEVLKKENDRQVDLQSKQSAIHVNESIIATNGALQNTNTLMLNHAERQIAIMDNQTTLVRRQNRLYRVTLYLTGINLLIGIGILYSTLTSNADKQEIERLRVQVSDREKMIQLLHTLKSDTSLHPKLFSGKNSSR